MSDTGGFTLNPKGRLTAVQYRGGYNGTTCDTTFTEMMSYGTPGNVTKKRLRVKCGALPNMDLDSTYAYDTEGRNTSMQYPSTWNGSAWVAGPNIGNEFDEMGRLKKLKNLTTTTDIISATTYNAMGELTSMTGVNGAPSETRAYNSIGQMTSLTSGAMQRTYAFSSSSNNGKIISENDPVSGETVTYTYDSLNRLASATSSDNPGWGQSFGYDGFGNLTTVNVTKGSAPSLSVSYNASTNRRTTDSADLNGNILQSGVTNYDVENRITAANITNGTARYSYAPGNKRTWRGTWVSGSQTVDELTFYSAGGAKLCAYNLSTYSGNLVATSTGDYQYFGGKMIRNAGGYVNQDRLGSIGKFFPYGQERPSATANGKEKFATYTRDAETGLDYAVNRYHSSGDARFLTPDPLGGSANAGDPSSWNRYAYAGSDPVNHSDPSGLWYLCAYVNGELDSCFEDGEGGMIDACGQNPAACLHPCYMAGTCPPPGGDGGGGGGGGGSTQTGPPQSSTSGTLAHAVAAIASTMSGMIRNITEPSPECQANVLDPLAALGFDVDAFVSYLNQGLNILDGTTAYNAIASSISDSAQAGRNVLLQACPGAVTVGMVFNCSSNPNVNVTALTSTKSGALTIYVRPGAIGNDAAANMSLLFHEALHGFGAAQYGDDVLQLAFFGPSGVNSANTRNLSAIFGYCQ